MSETSERTNLSSQMLTRHAPRTETIYRKLHKLIVLRIVKNILKHSTSSIWIDKSMTQMVVSPHKQNDEMAHLWTATNVWAILREAINSKLVKIV